MLTNHNLTFVNCKSFSVLTGHICFLLQTKLIPLAVLSSNYWCFDFNATRFNFFFGPFVLLAPFEFKSCYLIFNSSHWPKTIQRIIAKFFREKTFGLNGFDTFVSHFSTRILGFCLYSLTFIIVRHIVRAF